MRFMKGVLLVLVFLGMAASTAAFAVSYSVVSSAGSSLAMDLVDRSGGTGEVVADVLETLIPPMPGEEDLRAAVLKAAKGALPEAKLRELADQAISGFRKYMGSSGSAGPILVDLREVKTAFMNELLKEYPGSLDEIEEALEEIPDKLDVSGVIPVGEIQEVAKPYRLATNLPLVSAAVAGACLLVAVLAMGPARGLQAAGWCIAAGGAAALVASFLGADKAGKLLTDVVSTPTLDLPLAIDPKSLLQGLSEFVFARLRLVAGACAGVGVLLALLTPRIAKGNQAARPA